MSFPKGHRMRLNFLFLLIINIHKGLHSAHSLLSPNKRGKRITSNVDVLNVHKYLLGRPSDDGSNNDNAKHCLSSWATIKGLGDTERPSFREKSHQLLLSSNCEDEHYSAKICRTGSTDRKQFLQKALGVAITAPTTASLASLLSLSLTLQQPRAAQATYIDPKTKINLPSVGEIEQAIPADWGKVDNPFIQTNGNGADVKSSDFNRLNNADDAIFYKDPRFVEHVDENAVNTMQRYIQNDVLSKDTPDVLDLCSSWTSHIDPQTKEKLRRVAGLGMNEEELKANSVLSDYSVLDLNSNPNVKLPYHDATFDVVLCQLSIDYLIHPLNVINEVGRVLKKGGKVVILFSNRLFLEKAVGIWTGADDIDHAYFVASYIYFSNGGFQPTSIQAKDLSTRNKKGFVVGDPMYVVTAVKE